MTVTAPPRPPPMTESAGDDPGEALIEEAKQRARRRRWTLGVAGVVAAIAAAAAFTLPGSTSPPRSAAGDVPTPTPLGAPLVEGPDPGSTLLTSWGQIHTGYAFIYADGRVIWYRDVQAAADPHVTGAERRRRADGVPAPDGEYLYEVVERRLSPQGLELVRAGTFAPKRFIVANPDSYLREELWAEPTADLYEPTTSAICHVPGASLPAAARALLSGKQRTFDPKIGWSASGEPMAGYFQLIDEMDVHFPTDCFEVTAADASTLYQILYANGLTQGVPAPQSVWWMVGNRVAEVRPGEWSSAPQISSSAIYPHGQPIVWGG